jgi:hypothetical protein
MGVRKGRGRAATTLAMIDRMTAITEGIQPCGVRAVAYQLFVRKLIESMETRVVKRVSELCTIAREEGTMPWEWITDQTRAEQSLPTWKDKKAFARVVRGAYRLNKWQYQPVHVGVLSEKGTIEGTIRPVLEKYEVPFQVLHGWSGATAVWDMALANIRRHQMTDLLYVGDYDPSGMYMSEVDLPKRLARYSSNNPAVKDVSMEWVRRTLKEIGLDVRRVALTPDDTIDLGRGLGFPASDKGPQPARRGKPATRGDSRYPWFVENVGDWSWELDALNPTILRERLEDEILAVLDRDAWDRAVSVEEVEKGDIYWWCDQMESICGQVPK